MSEKHHNSIQQLKSFNYGVKKLSQTFSDKSEINIDSVLSTIKSYQKYNNPSINKIIQDFIDNFSTTYQDYKRINADNIRELKEEYTGQSLNDQIHKEEHAYHYSVCKGIKMLLDDLSLSTHIKLRTMQLDFHSEHDNELTNTLSTNALTTMCLLIVGMIFMVNSPDHSHIINLLFLLLTVPFAFLTATIPIFSYGDRTKLRISYLGLLTNVIGLALALMIFGL